MSGRCGVVVAHGSLADGLLSALSRVVGPQENLWALSNDGLSGEALRRAIADLLDERAAGRESFLFTDLEGGSCGQACRRLVDSGAAAATFHGANLPLLIEFVFLQRKPVDEMVEALKEKSRAAIEVRR